MTAVASSTNAFLARCVAGAERNPAMEAIRERGTEAVLAIYRLVKIGLIHSFDNDAVGQTLDQALGVLKEFSGLASGNVTITFADETVFVCGQLLRGTRSVFESAAELGQLLLRCDVTELQFSPDMSRAELKAAAQAIAARLRDGTSKLSEVAIPNVTMLKADALGALRARESRERGVRKALDYYASALVVMRRYFDELAEGSAVLPHRVKRIAQGLVGLATSEGPGLLALTALANAHRDDAGRALQSAILTIAIAGEMTSDRATVARAAMAALLADIGKVRLAGKEGRDRLVRLADSVDRNVPAMTSAVSIGVSGVTTQSALHTVTMFEATWLERQTDLGPLYGGERGALLQSQIVQLSRAVLDLIAPRDNARAVTLLEAIEVLTKNPRIERALLRILLTSVGMTPVGSVVELETGEWAVVAGPSRTTAAIGLPQIRVVIGREGRVIDPPLEWDLGDPPPGVTYPRIRRTLNRDETRFNVTRALL